jgi:dTDP-4-dehydrorhamnose reductase
MKKKILIIGGDSFLGSYLRKYLSVNYDVSSTYFRKSYINGIKVDVTNISSLSRIINNVNPSVLIDLVAVADPDYAELNKELTWKLNVESVKSIIGIIKDNNIKLIYPSSAYVFSGRNPPYKENAVMDPVNYYGETKMRAEKMITQNLNDYVILRLSKLYGYNSKFDKVTFVTKVLNKLRKNEGIHLENNVKKYPLLINDLVDIIDNVISFDRKGIYNVSSPIPITDYEWGLKIAKVFGFSQSLIKKGNIGINSQRPLNSKLDLAKGEKIGFKQTKLMNGLKIIKKTMENYK